MSREKAKEIIEKLVERYSEHQKEYHLPDYNEQKTRQDFINPFFKALGWDVDNEKGDSEAYREVIYEDKVVVKGKAKAPDYGFRLSGSGSKRLFYVEAKKPAVPIKTHKESAYQLRRYGSSAQAFVSILTNFEDFIVYDCSRVPKIDDSASVARLKHIHFKDYGKEFDFIYDTFSHEAITKGRFDKFVQNDANKKGNQTLDKEFVQSLDSWRKYLAINIAVNNRKLDDAEINFAVQQTLDRLIFLRFCEDRAVEPYGQLQKAVAKGDAYKNLFTLFKLADDKYNSGLFDFKKDQLTARLKIDNKAIKAVIEELYYPLCRYEFSVMPVEVLGNAYEQFLGKVIRVTPSRMVKIEEKPEVRKAGGVYYTPQNIVDYLVQETVGKLVSGKTPKEVEKIKIVDPACGSGSFLLGAYQFLLDWHSDYYYKETKRLNAAIENSKSALKEKNQLIKERGSIPLTPEGRLTTKIKKQILVNNFYGVDLDANAVEVTKLSLLLKCMEGETEASVKTITLNLNDRVLPNLDDNIKNGNSLIDSDYYDLNLQLDEDQTIKPFNWKRSFPKVFEGGGFNAVIGNPPWGAEFPLNTITYIRKKYISANEGSFDSYSAFLEKSISILCSDGLLGMITPDTFLRKEDFTSFRRFLFKNFTLTELIETGPVFAQVRDTWCAVFTIKKSSPNKKSIVKHKKISRFITSTEERLQNFGNRLWDIDTTILQDVWLKKDHMIIGYHATVEQQGIIDKIELNSKLGVVQNYKISRGEEGSKFNIQETKGGKFRMVIPADVKKNFVAEGKSINSEGLTPNKLTSIYSRPKIWIIRIQKMRWEQRIVSAVDVRVNSAGMKTLQSITDVKNDIKNLFFLQAIFTSKLINWWCINYLSDDMNQTFLSRIPVPEFEKKQKSQLKLKDEIIELAELISKLNRELQSDNLTNKTDQLSSRLEHTEERLNSMIFHLYGLSSEEVQIIETSLLGAS